MRRTKNLWYRIIYPYGFYPTPSIGPTAFLSKKATQLEWVDRYESNILYHSKLRCYLYYLLLIAFHNTQRHVQLSKTVLQQGKGVFPHLQACHSALISSVDDCSALEINLAAINEKNRSIINSFLLHWLASTVCCPKVVNQVDHFLEGYGGPSIYRQRLLATLNFVSLGQREPLFAMQFFFKIMDSAFLDALEYVKKKENADTKEAMEYVIRLQHSGMLDLVHADFSPRDNFFNHVLRQEKHESIALAYKRLQLKLLMGNVNDGHELLTHCKSFLSQKKILSV